MFAAVDWDRPAEIVVSKDGPFYVRGGIHIVEGAVELPGCAVLLFRIGKNDSSFHVS